MPSIGRNVNGRLTQHRYSQGRYIVILEGSNPLRSVRWAVAQLFAHFLPLIPSYFPTSRIFPFSFLSFRLLYMSLFRNKAELITVRLHGFYAE